MEVGDLFERIAGEADVNSPLESRATLRFTTVQEML